MSSKEFRPVFYYYIRRQWYSQLIALCDKVSDSRGNRDPIAVYWKAVGLGMNGEIDKCLRELEVFQARKDLQFPVTLAMIYFHKRAPSVDRETVRSLNAELSLSEDIAVMTIL